MNSPSQPAPRAQPRRWVMWLAIVLFVIFIVAMVAWMFTESFIESKIQTQLADLNLGETKIGSISVGLNGVAAHNIEFKLQPGDEGPWLKVGDLNINHPISELASGATTFNGIELSNAQATVTAQQLMELAASQGASEDFDLSQIKLPAENISVTNSNFHIQDGPQSLHITGVDLQIQQENETQIISGQIGDLLGGQWQINGNVEPAANAYSANVSTKGLQLQNEQWQSLPYVPDNFEKYLTAEGSIDVSADITGNAENPIAVDGIAKVNSLDLNLPSFELPVAVNAADVTFDLEKITATNLDATIDGQDQINGTATANISSFPIAVDFKTQFKQLSIESIRRIVPDIPETVTARTNGDATGSVNIAAGMRTNIKINANGLTEAAQYGDLQAASSQTTVAIESLVFDAQQAYESISGTVSIDADAADQPVRNIFTSFDIEALYKQLDLDGNFSGRTNIDLPLATAGDLKTWGMTFTGAMPTGKLAGQPIRDVNVSGRLNQGVLELSPLIATAEVPGDKSPQPPSPHQIQANVAWPLVIEETTPPGTVVLSGQDLPTPWVVALIQDQIFVATGEHIVKESSALAQRISELGGNINFNAQINIPTDQPDDIARWTAGGNIQNSKLIVKRQSLDNLSTSISLASGKLTLANVAGKFPLGGALAGDVTIDLNETAQHQINIDARQVPFLWLIAIAKNASPEFATQFNQAAGITEDQKLDAKTVAGKLAIKGNFTTLAPNSPLPWTANLSVESKELRLLGESFRKFKFEANSDSRNLIVKQFKTNIGNKGAIEGTFDWNLDRNSGNGNLDWNSLSIETLAQFAQMEGLPVTGATNGRLKLTSLDVNDPNFDKNVLPIDIQGQIAAVDLTAAKIKIKPFKVDIATRSGAVYIENFRTENKAIDFDLTARAELKSPFQFRSDGSLGKLQLSRLLKQSSVTQKDGEVADVSGVMSGDFHFSGQLAPLDIRTDGTLRIKRLSYNHKPHRDIIVKWDHLGKDWKKSKLSLKAFGGEVKMTELSQQPRRVRVDISNIDAVEVTTLFELPIELTGKLNGAASLNQWNSPDNRWADLELKGSSILVSEFEINDFIALAEYRDHKLNYEIDGAFLGGKFIGLGKTEVENRRLEEIEFPIEFKLNNALLAKLHRKSAAPRNFRNLDGRLSATAKFLFGLDRPFEGDGRVAINDLKWSKELVTRSASIHFNVAKGQVILDDVQADLKRGTIKANATIPYRGNRAGNYSCEIRQMDLARIAAVVSHQPVEIEGLFDARLNGQIGKTITGQGYIGVERASLHGVDGQSVRLPIQFSVSTANGSGRVEMRRSTFRLFNGTASGTAKVVFGSRLAVNADLKLTRINTGKMMRSLSDFKQADQGELNGRLRIKGNGIRSLRDLRGSFEGKLDRASAFQLPVLTDLARVLSGSGAGIQNNDFSSEDIRLLLDNGRVEVKSLNFSSSIADVAVNGYVFVDGRLDLKVAGRVERFNQPTLLEELADSPLAQIRGTPASFFAQAAEFISDRAVFLRVGGTASRPQIRVDSRQQLREEVIRYFLRGSQILPYEQLLDN